MTKSLFDIISSIDGYALPEINLKLKEIIDRRTQDADKLETISTCESIEHHITYLESLKQAKKFIQAVVDFIKNRHNTHEYVISPHRIMLLMRDVVLDYLMMSNLLLHLILMLRNLFQIPTLILLYKKRFILNLFILNLFIQLNMALYQIYHLLFYNIIL